MGLQGNIPGVDLNDIAVGAILPVSGVEYFNYFGDKQENTLRNLTLKGLPVITGTPVVDSGFVSFLGGTNFIDTQVVETAETTILAACRWPNAQAGFNFAVSTYQAPSAAVSTRNSVGASLYANGQVTSGAAGRFGSSADARITTIPTDTVSNWGLRAFRIAANAQRVQNLTAGIDQNVTGLVARDPTSAKFRIGHGLTAGTGGRVDIAAFAICSRYLSDADLNTLAAMIRAKLGSRATPIVV